MQRVGHVILDGVVDPKVWVTYKVAALAALLSGVFSSGLDYSSFSTRRRKSLLWSRWRLRGCWKGTV